MDLRDKRELNQGFGDGLARAFELAVTPVVFGAMGFGLDHLVGTTPLIAIVFGVLAVIGSFVKLWYGYDLEMRRKEAEMPWAQKGAHLPVVPVRPTRTTVPTPPVAPAGDVDG